MPHYIIFLILGLLITSCAKEDKAAPPPLCKLEAAAVPDVKLSTAPHRLGVPLDQENLTAFIWTPADHRDCFLSHQGKVLIGKIVTGDEEKSPAIKLLKPAPPLLEDNWKNFQEEFGAPVMGLTTFKFVEIPKEQIIDTAIVLKDTARPRDMWHEYSHFIIAKARAALESETLHIPDKRELELTLKKVKGLDLFSSSSAEDFKKALDVYADYLQKTYADEIAIEAVIAEISVQQTESLEIKRRDLLRTLTIHGFFRDRYVKFFRKMQRDFSDIIMSQGVSAENRQIYAAAIRNMSEQITHMNMITNETQDLLNGD